MRVLGIILLFAASGFAIGQNATTVAPNPVWQMQESGTTAGLRGIDPVDGAVAWASGQVAHT